MATLGIAKSPMLRTLLPLCMRWSSTATATATAATTATASEPFLKNDLSSVDLSRLQKTRNIGISAHIDSGKTTLTERILYYTGRIDEIHEVRGKDNVGAKMDSMELEREKGITIQSAATFTKWKQNVINIIDTPGHVDFTIEVERALRVLDGAILVLCAVGGVQSQTMTVDRQMKRYSIPRLCFINKLDRTGAKPFRVIDQLKQKLKLNAAAVQIPIGLEKDLQGVVDLVEMKAYYHQGDKGEHMITRDIPEELLVQAKEKRLELVAALADIDDALMNYFAEEKDPSNEELKASIRRHTLSNEFVPVFMGSAYFNRGVQPLLDGVIDYLPGPHQVENFALDIKQNETSIQLSHESEKPLVCLAFKLEEGRFGQLTYMRIYQGTLRKGDWITNVRTGKRIKVPRVVRMHSNEMEEVSQVSSGEICALFGVECASGDTFTDGILSYSMTSMYVPKPVISLSIAPKGKESTNFSKALQRFQREDPTFKCHVDPESKQTIISGMGELHLEIYVERMKREYQVECVTGKPQVAFRETITQKAEFNYTHKKQSGGSGQFARIVGYIEPIDESDECVEALDFIDETVGMNIPTQFIPAVEKGFLEAGEQGTLIGHPLSKVRMVLKDGLSHAVDSSEMAFKLAAIHALREAYQRAHPIILEPIMVVHLSAPKEFQGPCIALLNKRKGMIGDSEINDDYVEITSEVPLNEMFGFSTDLRSITQGKGEFSMEYKKHAPVLPSTQLELIAEYKKKQEEKNK